MSNSAPHTQAKKIVAALMHEARAAGWARVRFEIAPDGSTSIDVGMVDTGGADDFTSGNLRMGK